MRLLLLALYSLAWLLTLPFLKRSPRVSLGWRQRTMQEISSTNFDLWIQAASGGESLLTNMVLAELAQHCGQQKKLKVLVTSGTKEGIDSLLIGKKDLQHSSNLDLTVSYFPFDAPFYMRRAFARYAPKVAVIVETELWPGFLYYAHKTETRVLLINGRMSEKSFGTYKYLGRFFSQYGPEKIWAISEQDAGRFVQVVGAGKVELMNNIKFDRMKSKITSQGPNPISEILPKSSPFVLLGSIRKEEEDMISSTISHLLEKRPDIVIGLFPKHIERADPWLKLLGQMDIPALKRSTVNAPHSPGSVIVWDVFGELAGAYTLAKTTFIGGSLVNLGGQNFLEPLAFGVKPIIGPNWKDFAWVSRDIIASGLVHEVRNEQELTEKLFEEISADEDRDNVAQKVQSFFASRKGGTEFIAQQIVKYLP